MPWDSILPTNEVFGHPGAAHIHSLGCEMCVIAAFICRSVLSTTAGCTIPSGGGRRSASRSLPRGRMRRGATIRENEAESEHHEGERPPTPPLPGAGRAMAGAHDGSSPLRAEGTTSVVARPADRSLVRIAHKVAAS